MNAQVECLKKYYQDADFERHSDDQERDLIRRAQDGDLSARNELICNHLRFVMKVAGKYAGKGVDMEELVMEGNLGLFHAIHKFDLGKDVRFLTYAYPWVRNYIGRYIKNQSRTVRVPVHMQLEKNAGRRPAHALVAPGLSIETAQEEGVEIGECEFNGMENVQQKQISTLLSGLISRMKTAHQLAIIARFGLDGNGQRTLGQAGVESGYTRERVRQICAEFLEKARLELERQGITAEAIL